MVKRLYNLFNDDLKVVVPILVSLDKEVYPAGTHVQLKANNALSLDTQMALQEAVRDLPTVEAVVETVTKFPLTVPDVTFLYAKVYYDYTKPERPVEEADLEGDNEFVRERGYKINNPPSHSITFAEKEAVDA